MTPELKLKFQLMIYNLNINSSMGVDEKNIGKIYDIVTKLHELTRELYDEVYPITYTEDIAEGDSEKAIEEDIKHHIQIMEALVRPENDVTEATKELSAKIKAHRPESK